MGRSKRKEAPPEFHDMEGLLLLSLEQSIHVPMPVTVFVEYLIGHNAVFLLPQFSLSNYLHASQSAVMRIRAVVIKPLSDNISIELKIDVEHFIESKKTNLVVISENFFLTDPFRFKSLQSVTHSSRIESVETRTRDEIAAEYDQLFKNTQNGVLAQFVNVRQPIYENNIQAINIILETNKIYPDSPKYRPIVEAYLKFSRVDILKQQISAQHQPTKSIFKSLAAIAQA